MFSPSVRRFLGYLKPYRGLVSLAVLTGVARYLIPLALPWAMKVVVDDVLVRGAPHRLSLNLLMGGMTVLYVAHGFISYWRSNFAGVAGHNLVFDLRRDLYQHIQRMSLSFFERQRIGAIVTRITGDIASAQNFVGAAFVNTAMDLAAIGAIIVVLVIWHLKLALVSLAVLPCFALISQRLNGRIRKQSRLIHDQMQEISGELHEQFGASATIQSFNQEASAARSFDRKSVTLREGVLTNVRLQAIALGVAGTLTAIGPILVIWYGAGEVLAGRLSVGTLMAFYAYLGLLYAPVQRLTELSLILANSRAAMDRIFEVFDTQPDVRARAGARELGRVRGDIAFDGVVFRYDDGPAVLDGLDLRFPAGRTVALVGPSGAGKSTLVKLLPRFYDVTGGCISIDGLDVREATLASLRRNIAIVAQEPMLLSGTIADNLRFGKTDATQEEMRHAARLAFADEFIHRLPAGYETEIGERGVKLSGGQKQRLAIARAFLKDAPILILDEPTSALDPESESLIKHALEHLLQGRTALIIAHRLSTIEHADEVVVLDRGRVIERGSHQELADRPNGLYRRYAEHQLTMTR